ncbi:hypothetical protein IFM89_039319 [Coptis chinensis]|uniref:SET domain-containing protein n=1 Tax=Coptis chinensis TaxID=261450 RepID=A0A835HN70_9MAGN|nr:hypothetical protein IFM89_039319 [Coptis chinensis]
MTIESNVYYRVKLIDVVCSLCNRPGGSCIECRVVNCSVHFHPWCARQKVSTKTKPLLLSKSIASLKLVALSEILNTLIFFFSFFVQGLLQSEVEGVDNDKVGFYGRCVLHATHHTSDSVDHPMDINFDTPGREEFTCARTEGYKGRKKDGFSHNLQERSNGNGECLVPQEQIDAWLHINGHKSCTVSVVKTQTSEVEYDYRKEYARYKQAKGWKNLVVYKSGVHALGLYTSQFISRGAMVVEYIGEIVGLRVADKREIEYQSGRKLQYKGACYFFRIDKEHIIDATHKGGIARFVNHSCLNGHGIANGDALTVVPRSSYSVTDLLGLQNKLNWNISKEALFRVDVGLVETHGKFWNWKNDMLDSETVS